MKLLLGLRNSISFILLFLVLSLSANQASADQTKIASSLPKSISTDSAYVYRFWSDIFHGHFYTLSYDEATKVNNTDTNWKYEKVAFSGFSTQKTNTIPLYRFWSDNFHGHFYTSDANEMQKVKDTDNNWKYEMIAFYVYPTSYSGSSKTVYRFWSPIFKHHFYTADETEMIKVRDTDSNWTYEGPVFKVPDTSTDLTHGLSIKISPVLFDGITAAPGESLSGAITLSNPGIDQIILYPGTRNFISDPNSEEGVPKLTTESTPYEMMDWITFDRDEIELLPGTKLDVKFFIDIPKNASAGGHYGSLVFSTKDPQETSIKPESAVSAIILLTVSGNINESGVVESFIASSNVTDSKNINFNLRFRNTGNIHVKPVGTIIITDSLGNKLAEMNLDSKNVLPDSIRQFIVIWQPQNFSSGKYIATIKGTYGDSKKSFEATTSFNL